MVSRDAVLVGVAVAGLGAIASGVAEGYNLPDRAAGSAQNAPPNPNSGPAEPEPEPQPTTQAASDAASQTAQAVSESTSADVPSARDIGSAATQSPDEGGPVGGNADPQGGLAAHKGRDQQESRRGYRIPGTTTTVGEVEAMDTGQNSQQTSGGQESGTFDPRSLEPAQSSTGPVDPGSGRPSHPY